MSESPAAALGVVGDEAIAERLADAGYVVERGDPATVAGCETVVAVGADAVAAVAVRSGSPTLLPVDAGRGVRAVARDDVVDAAAGLADARTESHPVFAVEGPSGTTTGIWDVTLVTADAAHISEFSVSTPTDTVGRVRADGVSVATPAGSTGYTRRIGGPVLAPAAVAVVAPIAPFATNPDHWVLPLNSMTATVDRDEATVSLFVDGEPAGPVDCEESVTISGAGSWEAAVVPESRSRFARVARTERH